MKPAPSYLSLIAFLATVMISSCASNEIGQSKDINQETIYQQYDVDYSESDNKIEVVAQFRFAGVNGTTLVLNEPSKFECDGKTLGVDSSDFAGAFYKQEITGASATGTHRLVFTDIARKKFENSFTIEDFRLTDVPAAIGKSAPVLIHFEALPLKGSDNIELRAGGTDSSFTISHAATDSGNVLVIPIEQLKRQKGKEISLSATLYRNIELKEQAREGGLIQLTQKTRSIRVKLKD